MPGRPAPIHHQKANNVLELYSSGSGLSKRKQLQCSGERIPDGSARPTYMSSAEAVGFHLIHRDLEPELEAETVKLGLELESLRASGNRSGYEDLLQVSSLVQFHRECRYFEDCHHYAPQAQQQIRELCGEHMTPMGNEVIIKDVGKRADLKTSGQWCLVGASSGMVRHWRISELSTHPT